MSEANALNSSNFTLTKKETYEKLKENKNDENHTLTKTDEEIEEIKESVENLTLTERVELGEITQFAREYGFNKRQNESIGWNEYSVAFNTHVNTKGNLCISHETEMFYDEDNDTSILFTHKTVNGNKIDLVEYKKYIEGICVINMKYDSELEKYFYYVDAQGLEEKYFFNGELEYNHEDFQTSRMCIAKGYLADTEKNEFYKGKFRMIWFGKKRLPLFVPLCGYRVTKDYVFHGIFSEDGTLYRKGTLFEYDEEFHMNLDPMALKLKPKDDINNLKDGILGQMKVITTKDYFLLIGSLDKEGTDLDDVSYSTFVLYSEEYPVPNHKFNVYGHQTIYPVNDDGKKVETRYGKFQFGHNGEHFTLKKI